jgi:DNA-binding transcriptional LysR family regulator
LRAVFGLHDPSIALTKAGERLLVRMHTSLADLEEATEEATSLRGRPPGPIRVSISEFGREAAVNKGSDFSV